MDLLIISRNVYFSGKHMPGTILGFRDKIINKTQSLLRKALISLKNTPVKSAVKSNQTIKLSSLGVTSSSRIRSCEGNRKEKI